MIKKQLLIAGVLLTNTIHVMAVEWDSIIKKPDYEIFVDIDSYNVANGLPYFLTKTVFKNNQQFANKQKLMSYQYVVKNTQFNCNQPLYKVTSIDFYSSANKLLVAEKLTNDFTPLKSGTDEYSVAQLACQVHKMIGGQ